MVGNSEKKILTVSIVVLAVTKNRNVNLVLKFGTFIMKTKKHKKFHVMSGSLNVKNLNSP